MKNFSKNQGFVMKIVAIQQKYANNLNDDTIYPCCFSKQFFSGMAFEEIWTCSAGAGSKKHHTEQVKSVGGPGIRKISRRLTKEF